MVTTSFVRARIGKLLLTLIPLVSCHSQEPGEVSHSLPEVRKILFVTIDTLRASSTTPYQSPYDTTPALALFAGESIQFNRAYTTMPTTGPAHLSMLTGLYPREHGALSNGVKPRSGLVTLPRILEQQGFATGAFVSVHHLAREVLGIEGFDEWKAPEDGRQNGIYTLANAEQWLTENHQQSFFAWIHLFEPHKPYAVHKEYLSQELVARLEELESAHTSQGKTAFGGRTLSDRELAKMQLLYEADVYYADRLLDRLLTFVKTLGIYDETLIIITSDHGEMMGEAHRSRDYAFDHGEMLLPGEIQVPLWVRLPGSRREPSRVSSAVVEIRALFGSILWAAGLEVPAGYPLLPGLGQPESREEAGRGVPDSVAFVSRRQYEDGDVLPLNLRGDRYAMVSGQHLVIVTGSKGGPVELYHLKEDPLGLENRSGEDRALAERSEAILRQWILGQKEGGLGLPTQFVSEKERKLLDSLGYIR